MSPLGQLIPGCFSSKTEKTENHLLSASLKTRAFLSLSTESNSFDYKECGWFSST